MVKTGVIIMTLFGFLQAGWFANLFDNTPTPPISMPIDLYKAGSKVEFTTRIKKRANYQIWLEFINTDEVKNGISDSAISQKIAGYSVFSCGKLLVDENRRKEFCIRDLAKGGVYVDESYDCNGTTVPLKVQIYKINKDKSKKLIIDNIYQTKGTDGGWRYHTRRSVDCFLLEPGKYKVIIENINSIKEMKNRKADIYFGTRVYK